MGQSAKDTKIREDKKTGSNMDYTSGGGWIVKEVCFDQEVLGKTESVMCLGNGYLGVRSSAEEANLGETRNCFVAGTFNKADQTEVTELPNAADFIHMEIYLDNERFSLSEGRITNYEKTLDLKNGGLRRSITWQSPRGKEYKISFCRFVSLNCLHLCGQKVTIDSGGKHTKVKVITGLDGRMTNSGAQHFEETEKRFYDKKYMQYVQTTTQSKIDFVWNSIVILRNITEQNVSIGMGRRQIYGVYEADFSGESLLEIEKLTTVHTSRDKDWNFEGLDKAQEYTLKEIKLLEAAGYDLLFQQSCERWEEYWQDAQVRIKGNIMDQLGLNFAQYHLRIMTPFHDERMNIGAKGLSGEGYKGHTFWDTEVFILPYFYFHFPKTARKLLYYRFLGLEGARRKAEENGFEGAQYPWEAAWIEDGEVTPAYGDVDIVTGMPQKIWTGLIEQHITADIAFAVWQYYLISKDQGFMEEAGYEILYETADFWASRLEIGADGKLHINDVIGPDEYKEHVNDNAFTNYMAYWNLKKAAECLKLQGGSNSRSERWKEKADSLYLPRPGSDLVIAQDACYLSLQKIDLTKYKKQDFVLGIYRDYNADQLGKLQVSKQADLLLLLYLQENLFTEEVRRANWDYYEPKTLHDSSLSLSTHCIMANDLGLFETAYELFEKLLQIDLGPNMKSSDGGIHAASTGGIWQAAVFGFLGLRMTENGLRLSPKLPENWEQIECMIHLGGKKLKITADKNKISLLPENEEELDEFAEIYKVKHKIGKGIIADYQSK